MATNDPDLNVWTTGHHDGPGRSGLLRAANLCALLAGLAALAVASTTLFGWVYPASPPSSGELKAMRMVPVDTGNDLVDGRQLNQLLAHERAGKSAVEQELMDVRGQLAIAERIVAEAREELLAERETRKITELTLGLLRQELDIERNAREAAELATKEALNRKPKAWRLKKVESHWW